MGCFRFQAIVCQKFLQIFVAICGPAPPSTSSYQWATWKRTDSFRASNQMAITTINESTGRWQKNWRFSMLGKMASNKRLMWTWKKRSASSQVCFKKKNMSFKKKGSTSGCWKKRVEQGNNKNPKEFLHIFLQCLFQPFSLRMRYFSRDWSSLIIFGGQVYNIGTKSLHPGRLTWNLQITHLERKMIFQTSMIMVHVNLPGCIIYNIVNPSLRG